MGKSEKERRLEEEDRLSNLPDDVLLHILSFLDTQSACKTTSLSKSWHQKSLWTLLPDVSFSYLDYSSRQNRSSHFQSFNRFVNRVLDSHKPPQRLEGIKSFSLNYHSDSSFQPNQFNNWIRGALESNAEEIEVNVDLDMAVEVPLSVFSSVTLRNMKLQGEATLYSLYCPPCLLSLKVLSLKMLESDATELVSVLLSSCPVLEEFYFDGFCRTMRITEAPKLKKVVVNNETFMWTPELFEIDAPSLEYFSLKDMDPGRYVVKNLDNVVEAELSIMLHQRESLTCFFNLLHGLSNVKSLHVNICYEGSLPEISTDDLTSPHDYLPEFRNLVRLRFDGTSKLDLLPCFLQNSPKLETLIIERHSLAKASWAKPPLEVPRCLSFSLTNFTYKGFQGKEEEFECLKYISTNSNVLKTLTIQPDLSLRKKPRKERHRISKELAKLLSSTKSCEFVLHQKPFFAGKGLQNICQQCFFKIWIGIDEGILKKV